MDEVSGSNKDKLISLGEKAAGGVESEKVGIFDCLLDCDVDFQKAKDSNGEDLEFRKECSQPCMDTIKESLTRPLSNATVPIPEKAEAASIDSEPVLTDKEQECVEECDFNLAMAAETGGFILEFQDPSCSKSCKVLLGERFTKVEEEEAEEYFDGVEEVTEEVDYSMEESTEEMVEETTSTVEEVVESVSTTSDSTAPFSLQLTYGLFGSYVALFMVFF